jgi:hypothetical protein
VLSPSPSPAATPMRTLSDQRSGTSSETSPQSWSEHNSLSVSPTINPPFSLDRRELGLPPLPATSPVTDAPARPAHVAIAPPGREQQPAFQQPAHVHRGGVPQPLSPPEPASPSFHTPEATSPSALAKLAPPAGPTLSGMQDESSWSLNSHSSEAALAAPARRALAARAAAAAAPAPRAEAPLQVLSCADSPPLRAAPLAIPQMGWHGSGAPPNRVPSIDIDQPSEGSTPPSSTALLCPPGHDVFLRTLQPVLSGSSLDLSIDGDLDTSAVIDGEASACNLVECASPPYGAPVATTRPDVDESTTSGSTGPDAHAWAGPGGEARAGGHQGAPHVGWLQPGDGVAVSSAASSSRAASDAGDEDDGATAPWGVVCGGDGGRSPSSAGGGRLRFRMDGDLGLIGCVRALYSASAHARWLVGEPMRDALLVRAVLAPSAVQNDPDVSDAPPPSAALRADVPSSAGDAATSG